MSPQDLANEMLRYWQEQRAKKPEDRRLPSDDGFERDLEVIRQCLERKI